MSEEDRDYFDHFDHYDDFVFVPPRPPPRCNVCKAKCYWEQVGSNWVLHEKGKPHDCANNPKIKKKLFNL